MGENADQEKDIIDIIQSLWNTYEIDGCFVKILWDSSLMCYFSLVDVPLAKQEQILEYYLSWCHT